MNYSIRLLQIQSILVASQFLSVAAQSNQWYKWYEDNRDKPSVDNGILPTLSCPYGHFRQFKITPHEPGGIYLDGCMKCPPGVYGNDTNLESPNCTAPCPPGTYNDEEAAVSIDDCKPCSPGTYGKDEGMTNEKCSGTCSERNQYGDQFYSIREGLTSLEECDICPMEYNYYTCRWDVDLVTDTRQANHTYHLTKNWKREAAILIPILREPIW